MITLKVNGRSYDLDVEADTPLLWGLRDTIGLTGTKYRLRRLGVRRVHRPRRRSEPARLRWISGVGEEIVPLVSPAIYNAIFAATVNRIRSMPLRHHDLQWS